VTRPAQTVPASEWRAELRNAYRLRPDSRFLLAFGEIDRLAETLPAPPGKPAAATFSDGRWTVQLGESKVGTLPEFPDFSDYFPLLVAHAKTAIRGGSASAAARSSGTGEDSFLMPRLLKQIAAAEASSGKDRSFRDAARCFARLAFQMPDPLELAPLIPARALALLAAVRSREAHAGMEEEILLAHAMGYTRHAETLAATTPDYAPLRAFEALDDRALSDMASKPGASEEVRYLAVRRSTSSGGLANWKQARERFMPGNDSVAVIATGLEIELPAQVEVTETGYRIAEALPRAVARELTHLPSSPANVELVSQFETSLKEAVDAARGPLWDGAAVEAYYQAAHYAALKVDRWPPWTIQATSSTGKKLIELSRRDRTKAPDARGDTTGAPLLVRGMHERYQQAPPAAPQMFVEIRALMPWLDARPIHRFELAGLSRYQLQDPRAAEDLYRSLSNVLGEGSRKIRAEAALYLGDWATLHRLLGAPEITAPEATGILWNWYVSKVEPERLGAEYERVIERFPNDWNGTNYYVGFLRDRKEYRKACEIVERWLARNPGPRTPGHFHAHIRLAHNYVLTGEFDKGLKLLQGMGETESFQLANRKRGMAECLAGLGRLPEAEALAREAVGSLRGQSEAMRDLVQILWKEGKDADAVKLLADPGSLAKWEVCDALKTDFAKVFADRTSERLTLALDAIAKKPELRNYSTCVIEGFGNAGRSDFALRAAEVLSPPGPDRMDQLIVLYGYMKAAKGPEAATAWLKEKIPADKRNPLSMKALYTKNDDVLWDVIGKPNPNDHPEWVWIFRAVAFALRGSDADPRRAELLTYYGTDNLDSHHVMGRYLVGLVSERDMFALAPTSPFRSEIAYYLGVRAQREKRFRDACEWYRVAAESGEGTSPRSLALFTLGEWAGMRQGIWKLEAGGNEKK
jgi:tetratricopeptide (TPR) repeat protein